MFGQQNICRVRIACCKNFLVLQHFLQLHLHVAISELKSWPSLSFVVYLYHSFMSLCQVFIHNCLVVETTITLVNFGPHIFVYKLAALEMLNCIAVGVLVPLYCRKVTAM